MNQCIKIFLLGAIVTSGCSSVPEQPAPVVVSQPAVVVADPVPDVPPRAPQVPVAAEPVDPVVGTNPAIDSLVDQGWRYIQQREYERAIAVGERALRIDRYDPRVYLILAQTYRLQGDLPLSRQYAQRGLAVADSRSDVYRQLQALQ